MSVSAQTPYNSSTADGSTDTFPYDFLIYSESEMVVRDDGVTKVLSTDYTITGVGNAGGGTVVFNSDKKPANGHLVEMERAVPYSRLGVDYQTTGDFRGDTVDMDIDRVIMMVQQVLFLASLGLTLPKSAGGVSGELPLPEALKVLRWNAAEDGIENVDPGSATLQVPADASVSYAKLAADVLAVLAGKAGAGANGDITNLSAVTSGSVFRRNVLINPSFDIWQRGTSVAQPASTVYTADRWFSYRGGFVTGATVSRQAGFSGLGNYCARVQRDNGNTSTQPISLCQVVETADCVKLAGKTVSLSFNARKGANYSAAADVLSVSIKTGTGADQGSYNYANGAWTGPSTAGSSTFTLTSSGQTFKLEGVSVPSNAKELAIAIGYAPVGTAGAADYFEISEVQLEVSSVATAFEYVPFAREVALCARYLIVYGGNSAYEQIPAFGVCLGTTTADFIFNLGVEMRTGPTMSYSAPGHFAVNVAAGAYAVTAIAQQWGSAVAPRIRFTVASGLTAGQAAWLAGNNTSSARLYFDAEL